MGDIVAELTENGVAKFSRLGWKRRTVVLIVEAIALGSSSIPSTFATLGMVAGVVTSVGLGIVAIYTSYIGGGVKLKYPEVRYHADAGRLLMGRFGYEFVGVMFVLQLVLLVGSHCLTGAIALLNITSDGACSLVFGLVSAIILLLMALPPSFAMLTRRRPSWRPVAPMLMRHRESVGVGWAIGRRTEQGQRRAVRQDCRIIHHLGSPCQLCGPAGDEASASDH